MENRIKALYMMIGNKIAQKDTDILSLCSILYRNYLCTDRFGYMNKFSKWKLDKSDDYSIVSKPISLSFKEIFNKRIEEIIDRSNRENLNIYVSWSGGVDSTTIVCGFLMHNVGYKLKILHNYNSIDEFPEMFDHLQNNGIELIDITGDCGYNYNRRIKDGLIVTGWDADQLFGSAVCNNYPNYTGTYKEWIRHYSKLKGVDYSDVIGQSEETFDYYNLPVKSFVQWCWFTNFFTKWHFIKLTPCAVIGEYSDRMVIFYDTVDFQRWCLTNFDKITFESQYDNKQYKKELKDIIYEYFPNKNYLFNKDKKNSWITYNSTLPYLKCVLVTNEFTDYYIKHNATLFDAEDYIEDLKRNFK